MSPNTAIWFFCGCAAINLICARVNLWGKREYDKMKAQYLQLLTKNAQLASELELWAAKLAQAEKLDAAESHTGITIH